MHPDTTWWGESRTGKRRRARATVFGALLSASLVPDLAIPPAYLTLNDHGRVNYWLPGSEDAKNEPYPDDLDDTAITIGLKARAHLVTPEEKAGFVKLLIQQEQQPGGPYRTWCTSDPAWQNVDPVVNANVAWALKQCNVELKPLTRYLQAQWEQDAQSPYYPNRWVNRALLLRVLPPNPEKVAKLLAQDPPCTQLAQAAARFCCLLAGLEAPAWRVTNPTWQPLITERAGKEPTYSGSRFATQCWQQAAVEATPQPVKLYKAYQTFPRQASPLWQPFEPLFERLKQADRTGALAGIAREAAQAFHFRIPETKLKLLEHATIWGWLTYTLADRVMDGEEPVSVLPNIQWATRQTATTFVQAAGTSFTHVVEAYLTRVDEANAWELKHARLSTPSSHPFPPLSERSIAHLLGPLAVLHLAKDPHASEVVAVGAAYLALRQHLDDAHDWFQDHERGIRTEVGDLVRQAAGSASPAALRRAYSRVGVPFVLTRGNQLLAEFRESRHQLPEDWQSFLCHEEERLAQALQCFQDSVTFTRAFHATS